MRCPKCHYLSFDPQPRCKNCGYDLDVDDKELADLPLRERKTGTVPVTLELVRPLDEDEPVDDRVFDQREHDLEPVFSRDRSPAPEPEPEPALAGVSHGLSARTAITKRPSAPSAPGAREAAAPSRRPPARAPHTTTELPLFVKEMSGAPPLSVRRSMPEITRARVRVDRRPGPLDHDLLEDLRRVEKEEAAQAFAAVRARAELAFDEEMAGIVAPSKRASAAAIDGVLLGSIGAFVLWATLRICNVGVSALGAAALAPLGAFLGGVAVWYFLMFTAAGGQTFGKMVLGLRVITDGSGAADDSLSFGQAAARAVLAPISVLVLGLGWLPAFFGAGRTLHDRLTHTRVVRV